MVALAIEGPEAVRDGRYAGENERRDARRGTIRGDFGLSRQMNLAHGSDSPEAAKRELAIYLPGELFDYEPTLKDRVCGGR
ncbi:MAG: nucleoside-diphosphate kinase [Planctomycetaceae bacterium]